MADTFAISLPQIQHPVYLSMYPTWVKLRHVREGTGGFMDGTYLVGHPREWEDHQNENPVKPTKKLKARRKIASYTNYADAILDSKKSALFREAPTRRVGEGPSQDPKAKPVEQEATDLERWWENVDGKGTDIDAAMPQWWDPAATFGHVGLYFEIPSGPEPAEGEVVTAADQGLPVIRAYNPEDIVNWLTDDAGNVTAVKLREAVPVTGFETQANELAQYRTRVVDADKWELFDHNGTRIDGGEHKLGKLPFVYLFGKRRAVVSQIGQAIIGDPQAHIDVYNLESELRELLRNQTFSFINIPLGTGTDAMTVEQAQQMLGNQTGTMNVVFSGAAASILSGDAANVTAYQEQIRAKVRAIYREAGSPWESDTKDAEAEGSLSIKREELNTRLAQYAYECQQAEWQLAELFYRWRYGADRGVDKMEDDEVTIQYPDRFGQTPFDDVLSQVQAAQSIGMPAIFLKELRKAIVAKFEGMASLAPQKLQEIMDAIESEPDDPTPQQRMTQRMDLMKQATDAGVKAASMPDVGKEAA